MKFNFSISQLKSRFPHKHWALIDPARDWQIIIAAFIVLTICLLTISGYIYVKISSGQIFLVKDSTTVESNGIDQATLNSILRSFEAKQVKFNQFRDNKVRLVDPSI